MDDEYTPKKRQKKKTVSGWYFPPEVVVLFHQGMIGPRDLIVLGVISSLTKTYENGSTIPCFASNRYIGEKCRIKAATVSKIISRLITHQLIKKYTKADQNSNNTEQRYLLPSWRKGNKGSKIVLRKPQQS